MRSTLIAAALVLVSMPALGRDLPEFDLFSFCFNRTPTGSEGNDGISACMAREERDAVATVALYRQAPARLQADCEAFSRRVTLGTGSYATLNVCLSERGARRPG